MSATRRRLAAVCGARREDQANDTREQVQLLLIYFIHTVNMSHSFMYIYIEGELHGMDWRIDRRTVEYALIVV